MDKDYIVSLIQKQKESLTLKNVRDRVAVLKKLKQTILLMKTEIFEALKKDLNKSEPEAYMTEVGMVLEEISYMIKHCKKLSKPKKVIPSLSQVPGKAYKMPCPYGSVLVISPWNYPFMLSMTAMVDAVSAGNSVIIKPSEMTSNVSGVISKIVNLAFKPEQVYVVLGNRENCEFLLEQNFDYMFFTGSSRVGKIVMQKASEKFIPVTLELGGKSPCVVDETADISLAAKRIVFGKLLNAGQTCVAPDFLYCAKSIKDKLVKEIKRQIVLQYSVDPIRNPDYPRIANERQYNSLVGLLDKKKIIFGGKTNERLLKIEPTLIESNFGEPEMQGEIFGPILPIITFEKLDEVIENIKTLSTPLALYFFSTSKENQNKIMTSCDFGGGCINDTIIHISTTRMGFGGLKQSGIGSYHGKTGFDTFSHYKSIVNKKNYLDFCVRYQPYNKFKYFIMKKILK